jgi:lipoprotein-anchoring transpeptidase ErfK/SrfK
VRIAAVGAAIVILALAGDSRAHHHRARKTELAVADLGWPAGTQTVRLRVDAKVRAAPKKHGARLGKLAVGDRVRFTRIVATPGPCRAWIAIEPRGWVCAREVAPSDDGPLAARWPHKQRPVVSDFSGLDLAITPIPGAFGWAIDPKHPARDVRVRAAPDGEVVRTIAPRTVVPVLEERDGFARIGDEAWIARASLREVAPTARPDGVAADAPWIDVDLDEQVLVAYRGDTRVFATLVSTGKRNSTPTGLYHVTIKIVQQQMTDHFKRWDYARVPYILYFRTSYALHGAYWHDHFGAVDSVGCVNLTPADARRLFELTEPRLPEGWLEVRAVDGDATAIRIRSRRDPTPRPFDYDGDS